MSKQVTLRLSEELLEFIDDLVANGEALSRAAVVSRALNHERRRIIAAQDVAILARLNGSDKLHDLAVLDSHMALDIN
ncbi:MAG: antitoxin [Acidimicrobiales bacterium]|nr:antitoxin [Acidimicrobiales bacterium]